MGDMYNPCFECYNRHGHSYTEACDHTCHYAYDISRLKQFGGMDKVIEVMKGNEFPLVFIDKDHIDSTYKIVCAAKDGFI